MTVRAVVCMWFVAFSKAPSRSSAFLASTSSPLFVLANTVSNSKSCSTTSSTTKRFMSTAPTEVPKPMIFAIMRNGHEVIRGANRDLKALLDKDDLEASAAFWDETLKWLNIHKAMEEGSSETIGLFQMLDDKCDGIVSKSGVRDIHDKLNDFEVALSGAFASNDLEQAKVAFQAYADDNEQHMLTEEGILMPMVVKMTAAGEPMKQIMEQDIMPLVYDEEHFIKFSNLVLERNEDGMPKVRVLDHALWAIAGSKWSQWDEWIQQVLSPAKYDEVQNAIAAFKDFQKQQMSK